MRGMRGMTALRCTQKLLTAMKVKPISPPAPGANRLGDWSLNLLHMAFSESV